MKKYICDFKLIFFLLAITLSGLVKGEQDSMLPIFNALNYLGQSSNDEGLKAQLEQLKNNPVIIRKQCEIFIQNQLACSVAGDFNNCMLIRLNVNKSELKYMTKQCRQ